MTTTSALKREPARDDATAAEPSRGQQRSAIDPAATLRVVRNDGNEMADTDDLPIWREDGFHADAWSYPGADDAVSDGPAVLPLERFLAEHEALSARNAPIGVRIEPNEAVEEIAPFLDRVPLVIVVFPKFSDGRAMSAARLLRERYDYKGEIRASGDVLIDQMPLMKRCGVDSFAVTDASTRRQLAAGKWPDIPLYFQPLGSTLQGEVPAGKRPWARRLAPKGT